MRERKRQVASEAMAEVETKQPVMYNVILHNDDYTTMHFVVQILEIIFDKTSEEAFALMLTIHNDGWGVAGQFVLDIALTKKMQADQRAKVEDFPLFVSVKKA